MEVPARQDVTQLRDNCKFVWQLSSIQLLESESKWLWGKAQQTAFATAKQMLTFAGVLAHFDPEHKIILSCDASPYGVGAVIVHLTPDVREAYCFRIQVPFPRSMLNLIKRAYSMHKKNVSKIVPFRWWNGN